MTSCVCLHLMLHCSLSDVSSKEHERSVRDLKLSLKESTDRLSKYDGLPESQQIRQRMHDLEVTMIFASCSIQICTSTRYCYDSSQPNEHVGTPLTHKSVIVQRDCRWK